jgi:exonuclease SbcC
VLNKLSCSVTFPTTGRTLAGEFEFKPGFGLINGANEQGKSLIIEVVRWCLFGSTALRGKAEDYKTLRATLQFSARGQSYVVDRTYTTAKLMQAMSCCASGQSGFNPRREGCENARKCLMRTAKLKPNHRHRLCACAPTNQAAAPAMR